MLSTLQDVDTEWIMDVMQETGEWDKAKPQKQQDVAEEEKSLSVAATIAGLMFCTLASIYNRLLEDLFHESVDRMMDVIQDFMSNADHVELNHVQDPASLEDVTNLMEIVGSGDRVEPEVNDVQDPTSLDIADLISLYNTGDDVEADLNDLTALDDIPDLNVVRYL